MATYKNCMRSRNVIMKISTTFRDTKIKFMLVLLLQLIWMLRISDMPGISNPFFNKSTVTGEWWLLTIFQLTIHTTTLQITSDGEMLQKIKSFFWETMSTEQLLKIFTILFINTVTTIKYLTLLMEMTRLLELRFSNSTMLCIRKDNCMCFILTSSVSIHMKEEVLFLWDCQFNILLIL